MGQMTGMSQKKKTVVVSSWMTECFSWKLCNVSINESDEKS